MRPDHCDKQLLADGKADASQSADDVMFLVAPKPQLLRRFAQQPADRLKPQEDEEDHGKDLTPARGAEY